MDKTSGGYYLISAFVVDDLRSTRFSMMKSFSVETLASMTVAELTRRFVEELFPNCMNFICKNHHAFLRYGDDTETEIIFGKYKTGKERASVHSISISLPVEDQAQNNFIGYLHPSDIILDYLSLARKCGITIPVCIHSKGPPFGKPVKRKRLRLCCNDDVDNEDKISYGSYYGYSYNLEESSAMVSHEDDDLSETSLGLESKSSDKTSLDEVQILLKKSDANLNEVSNDSFPNTVRCDEQSSTTIERYALSESSNVIMNDGVNNNSFPKSSVARCDVPITTAAPIEASPRRAQSPYCLRKKRNLSNNSPSAYTVRRRKSSVSRVNRNLR